MIEFGIIVILEYVILIEMKMKLIYLQAAKEYSVLYETSRFSGMMGLKGQPVRIGNYQKE